MSQWHKLNLGDPLLAGPVLDGIRRSLAAPPTPEDKSAIGAAFLRHESEGRLHCELHVYLSPGAASLASSLGARACGKPRPAGLELLAGPREAWTILFPGSAQARALGAPT